MSRCHSKLSAGAMPATHQGSWARFAQAEKVRSSACAAGLAGQHRPAVQPPIFEVGRLEPAWVLALSNLPTSPTYMRTHIRDLRTRIRAHRVRGAISFFGKHQKQVRQVRRLDEASTHAGFSRLTSSLTFGRLDEVEAGEGHDEG